MVNSLRPTTTAAPALVDVIGVLWKVVRGFREMTVEGLVDWRKDDSREIHHETDDEGIERDSGDSDEDYIQHCSLDRVLEHLQLVSVLPLLISSLAILQHCSLHLAAPSAQEADSHYRAVCRALVAEALELSSFLDKVSQGTQELQNKAEAHSTDLDNLKFSDWVSSATFAVRLCSLKGVIGCLPAPGVGMGVSQFPG
ncbi:unnamed protein product [Timema podura]|uniref:KIND domain-containing protein n=1 Tax=Timema podura TaxID=61482 RepID=A0ABN7NU88_TIMPD|nr:unnamed protein product [Timema podura]